ncbi:MAG: hypothetical protein JW894_14195 [Bacteroidales bacterium]|nr:hypothetical protein [Bacteroidales bacterium]
MNANFYKMYPELKFAIVKLQSEVLYFHELKQLNHEYKLDVNYSNIHYLLIEIDKKCKLNFTLNDLTKLSELYNTEYQVNNHKIIVWLVAQPLITALTHLFVLKTKDNSLYCSTIDKAYKLLNIPIDFEKFKNLTQILNYD